MSRLPDLPHYIIRKSKNYFYNTLNGQYIRAEHIQNYLSRQQQKPVRRNVEYWWTKF